MTHTRAAAEQVRLPAWLRVTRGESRWPVAAAMVVAIGLQLALPDNLALLSRWLLPGLELALLLALIIASPVRFDRESRVLRVGQPDLDRTAERGQRVLGHRARARHPRPVGSARTPRRCCPPERRSG